MTYQVVPPNSVYELTMTLEEGLLLPCNILMKFIIESTLARAQKLQPLEINHFLVEPSHIHLLITVGDPGVIPDFVERVKTELAHYINTMLGRRKRSIWDEGSFCVPILTVSSVIKKIVYIYTNPAKDGLEDSIESYPGLSSWRGYRTGKHKKVCPRLSRTIIPYLPEKQYSENTYKKHRRLLRRLSQENHTLEIMPDGWMKVFSITDSEQTNSRIIAEIEQEEQRLRKQRTGTVIGKEALSAAHLDLDYVPKNRTGKKMWCICDDREMRKKFINWAKEIKSKAKAVYQRWKLGDFSVKYPPGVYPPAMPRLSNMVRMDLGY